MMKTTWPNLSACTRTLSRTLSGAIIAMLVMLVAVSADELPESEHRYHASLGAGYNFLEKDEEILAHQNYEARLGYRASDRWTFEGGFGGFPYVRRRKFPRRGFHTLDGDTSGFRFIGEALYHWDREAYRSSIDPYLAVGLGIAHYNKELEDGHNDVFMTAGAGTFIDITNRWFFKPDYRVAMVGHDTEVNHYALFSLGYRWGGKDVGVDRDFGDTTAADAAGLRRVYFAFDSSDLSRQAQADLKHNAQWLKDHPQQPVTIEGHCDERGTNEYNLALGARRAQSVYDYLLSLGISKGRLSTVSYGEEFPAVNASNEAAWAKNRRVEFSLDGSGTARRR